MTNPYSIPIKSATFTSTTTFHSSSAISISSAAIVVFRDGVMNGNWWLPEPFVHGHSPSRWYSEGDHVVVLDVVVPAR